MRIAVSTLIIIGLASWTLAACEAEAPETKALPVFLFNGEVKRCAEGKVPDVQSMDEAGVMTVKCVPLEEAQARAPQEPGSTLEEGVIE